MSVGRSLQKSPSAEVCREELRPRSGLALDPAPVSCRWMDDSDPAHETQTLCIYNAQRRHGQNAQLCTVQATLSFLTAACMMHMLGEPQMEQPFMSCQAYLQLLQAVPCTPATPQRATAGPAAASRSCWSLTDQPGQQEWQSQPGLRAL